MITTYLDSISSNMIFRKCIHTHIRKMITTHLCGVHAPRNLFLLRRRDRTFYLRLFSHINTTCNCVAVPYLKWIDDTTETPIYKKQKKRVF